MEYLPVILTVALVHFLAVVSPGPDFIMIVRNSLIYSRRAGMYSALGLSLGILVHITYSLVGIGLLIANSIVLFNTIKYLGAAYLIYIGIKSLISKSSKSEINDESQKSDISPLTAVKQGFLTNITNPKATLFFLSLFTLVISPQTPLFIKIIMALEMAIVQAAWFILLAFVISHPKVKNKVSSIQNFSEKFIGIVLIALGVKVAFSSSK